jgi:hypothetical protein
LRSPWSINLRAVGICAALAVGASLGVLAPAALAAPPNDQFANRTVLGNALPVHLSESNSGATRDGNAEISAFSAGHSIWWEWESPLTEWTTVSTCDSEFRTVDGVFEEGEFGYLKSLSVGNSAEGPGCWSQGSRYTFWAEAGHDYEIAADGFDFYVPPAPPPPGEGTITLAVEPTPPPPNDAFAAATPIGDSYAEPGANPFEPPNDDRHLYTSINGYNWGATADPGEPQIAPGDGASVWYSWTPPESGTVTLSTCCQATPELLALYAGSSLADLTPIASRSGSETRLSASVTGGAPYMIEVAGGQDSTAGRPHMASFSLGLEMAIPRNPEPAPAAPASEASPTAAKAVEPAHSMPRLAVPTLAPPSIDSAARSVTFRFASKEKGARYRCRLDAKPFHACSSPLKLRGMTPGKHRLEVVAMVAGRTASDPAVARFSVPAPRRHRHRAG